MAKIERFFIFLNKMSRGYWFTVKHHCSS